jgi:beta-lactamase superfamily II metal-dependent hydrolase
VIETLIAKAEQKWTTETWANEKLKDGGITSASNESSTILFGNFGPGRGVLLTGDAGNTALSLAADYADQLNLPLQNFTFGQIPHHGSRRNVGPTVLDRLFGPALLEGSPPTWSAFVSAPKDDATHPRKMVLNAFVRRGATVLATQGTSKVFWGGFTPRQGYTSVAPMPFSSRV